MPARPPDVGRCSGDVGRCREIWGPAPVRRAQLRGVGAGAGTGVGAGAGTGTGTGRLRPVPVREAAPTLTPIPNPEPNPKPHRPPPYPYPYPYPYPSPPAVETSSGARRGGRRARGATSTGRCRPRMRSPRPHRPTRYLVITPHGVASRGYPPCAGGARDGLLPHSARLQGDGIAAGCTARAA